MTTVPAADFPAGTLAGARRTEATLGGPMSREAERERPLSVAVILERPVGADAEIESGKVAEAAPTGMATLPGSVTSGEEEASETVKPPTGAATSRETVPVAEVPARRREGDAETDERLGGPTSTTTVAVREPSVAVTVTGVGVATVPAETLKRAMLKPAAMTTEEGAVRTGEETDSEIGRPPAGATSLPIPTAQLVPRPDRADGGVHPT